MEQKRRKIPRPPPSDESSLRLESAPFGQPLYGVPELPDDITSIDEQALMKLFSQYVEWQNYAAVQFAEAEVAEARAEANVKFEEATNMVTNWTNAKDKVTVARAEMAMAPE